MGLHTETEGSGSYRPPHPGETLNLVLVGRALDAEQARTLGNRLIGSFHGAIRGVRIVNYTPPFAGYEDDRPPLESIEALLLTKAIHAEIGGHCLGVTSLDLLGKEGADDHYNCMIGGKDGSNSVAVVSTHRIRSMGDLAGQIVVSVSGHEVGHNFGLVHHRTPAGTSCYMDKGAFNRYGEEVYLRAVVAARETRFCRPCESFLKERYA